MGRRAHTFDWIVFVSIITLISLGLITQLSISPGFFNQQLLYCLLGIGLFLVFMRIDFGIYEYLTKYIFFGSILFLLLSYLGPNVRGATRWLDVGGIRIQPSEFVKPFFILGISYFIKRYPLVKIKHIALSVCIFITFFFIIFRQPDLGNALVYAAIWVGMMIIGGLPVRYFAASLIGLALLSPIFYNWLHDYQRLRLITFIDPALDPKGAGYNALQSMISVGSGQLWGRGFGRGTQSLLQFLPERHTDFVFASFAEEFGLLGALVLLILMFLLLYRLLKQAENMETQSAAYLYSIGLFTQLLTQIVINVGMNLGILPVTGITLPFISYGGSSLLAILLSFGIYISARANERR